MKADLARTVAVAAVAALYLSSFVAYGYHFGEDGDVVYLIYRAYSGQRPYIDFASGYTPGFFHANALLFHWFGVDLRVLRWSLVVVNTTAVVALYRIGCQAMPKAFALVAALAYMAFMPVFPGEFATFNVPYPAWHVVAFWGLSVLSLLRARRGARAWMFAAGLLAGLACAFKPNTGAFNLAALAMILLAGQPKPDSRAAGVLWWGLLLGCALGLAAALGFQVGTRDGRLLLWPVFALLATIAVARAKAPSSPASTFTRDVLLLLGGFALVTVPWTSYYLVGLGPLRFARDVLFIGGGHQSTFHLPIPPLDLWDASLAVLVAGTAAVELRGRRLLRPTPALALLLGVVGAIGFVVLWHAPMPEGFQPAVQRRLQHLAYGAAIVAHWSAVLLVYRRLRHSDDSLAHAAQVAIAISAPLMFLSIYPRSDFFHWVLSAPFSLLLGAMLVWIAVKRLVTRPALRPWFAVPAYAALAAIWLPGVALASRLWLLPANAFAPLGLDRAPVVLEAGRAPRLEGLRGAVEYIRQNSPDDTTLLGFPNLHFLNLLSGRQVPGRRGSFHPGWPDHLMEAEIIDDLQRRHTPLVVLNHDPELYIGTAPIYYYLLASYLSTHYALETRLASFDILRRRDQFNPGATFHPVELPVEASQPPTDCKTAVAFVLGRQEMTAEALSPCWRTPDADLQSTALAALRLGRDTLGAAAVAEALRNGTIHPDAAVLAVRVIGDIGDARAIPAAARASEQLDGQAADELRSAIFNIAIRSFMDSYQLFPRTEPLDAVRNDADLGAFVQRWQSSSEARLRYAAAWLAGVRADADAIPYLRSMLADPVPEFQAVAVEALLRLHADGDLAEVLLSGMAEDDVYFPTLALKWARAHPDEARTALANTAAHGNARQRESIVLISALLGDPALYDLARRGVGDPEPRVRMASAWALGMSGDVSNRNVLETVSRSDADARVSDFADAALLRLTEDAGANLLTGPVPRVTE